MGEFSVREEPSVSLAGRRRVYPMKIGDAIVYVEQTAGEPEIESTDFYPVAAPSPEEAFQKASEAIKECVRVVGDRIKQLAEDARPGQISVEFSIGFEAKGKASFIPILFQAEATANTALKVTAVWRLDTHEST